MDTVAKKLKLSVYVFDATTPDELTKAFNEMAERRPDGLVITIDIMFLRKLRRIAELARGKREAAGNNSLAVVLSSANPHLCDGGRESRTEHCYRNFYQWTKVPLYG